MPLRTLKCSVSECTRFCPPLPFSFQSASENAHFETKMHQISLHFETHPKKKSPKIPINKDFSGKNEDTDIVSISASFVGGELGI